MSFRLPARVCTTQHRPIDTPPSAPSPSRPCIAPTRPCALLLASRARKRILTPACQIRPRSRPRVRQPATARQDDLQAITRLRGAKTCSDRASRLGLTPEARWYLFKLFLHTLHWCLAAGRFRLLALLRR
ncbi:hypothetical protein C2E23DRAFT_414302 [Lenzites betulinus]|nr:hypothetical protein C2E23DRAFT_414302 [Lenzites betulinus]